MPPPCLLTCTAAGLLFHLGCSYTEAQTSAAGPGCTQVYTEALGFAQYSQWLKDYDADSTQASSTRQSATASCTNVRLVVMPACKWPYPQLQTERNRLTWQTKILMQQDVNLKLGHLAAAHHAHHTTLPQSSEGTCTHSCRFTAVAMPALLCMALFVSRGVLVVHTCFDAVDVMSHKAIYMHSRN